MNIFRIRLVGTCSHLMHTSGRYSRTLALAHPNQPTPGPGNKRVMQMAIATRSRPTAAAAAAATYSHGCPRRELKQAPAPHRRSGAVMGPLPPRPPTPRAPEDTDEIRSPHTSRDLRAANGTHGGQRQATSSTRGLGPLPHPETMRRPSPGRTSACAPPSNTRCKHTNRGQRAGSRAGARAQGVREGGGALRTGLDELQLRAHEPTSSSTTRLLLSRASSETPITEALTHLRTRDQQRGEIRQGKRSTRS